MEKNLLLKVDPHLSFSINTQIKEQLKWLIGIGYIHPGDMLPAANQMADILGLNRNTVNLVYNQLRDEGIVSMQKGRGTQVLDGAKVEELHKKRMPMHELLTKTIEEVKAQGIPLNEFFAASLAYILLHEQQTSGKQKILFVECKGHDHIFYRNEIERITHAEVKTVFLEDLLATDSFLIEAVEYSNLAITTLNHTDEVQKLFARYDKKVFSIGATIEMPLLLEIAKLKPDNEVSFVCLGKSGGQWMAGRVHDAGISQIRITSVGMDDKEHLREALEKSNKVYASTAVYSELKTLAPDKVELFPMVLEKTSENMLKEFSKSAK